MCPFWVLQAYERIKNSPNGRDHPFILGMHLLEANKVRFKFEQWVFYNKPVLHYKILDNFACHPAFIKMSASMELIMESLDWDYAISPIFFLREQEKANKAWFQTYLENISKGFILSYNLTTREAWRFTTQLGRGRNAEITLQGVYGFLTGSFHVPINWREMHLKVIFRHPNSLKEMEGFHP